MTFDARALARAARGLFLIALMASPVAAAPKTIDGVVNINVASAAELQLLPGVGPAKAELILAYRRQRPFRTVEELARVKGIGPKTVRKLKPHLSIRGDTTARQVAAPPRSKAPDTALNRPPATAAR